MANLFINLYPDMSREQYQGSEDFIYSAPIDSEAWNELLNNHAHMNTANKVRFVNLSTFTETPIVIMMEGLEHTDEALVEAGAWIRMTLGFHGLIYCVPRASGQPTMAEITNRTMGAPRKLCKMIDIPTGDDDES